MVFNGLGLLAVLFTVLAIYRLSRYIVWRNTDKNRRLDRLSKRGLA